MRPQLQSEAELVIQEFISSKVAETGAKGVIIGLSGGIDSALVTKLSVNALGADKVLNLFLPSDITPDQDRQDVERLVKALGTKLLKVPIGPVLEAYEGTLPSLERKELRGNLMARVRMSILYHHARMQNKLVLGTGNKSELLMGYFTKFGDGGADFLPIGDLYKTEVWELARKLSLPDFVINKTPSAGLWSGQTDEGEMGVSYADLDRVLYGIELSLSEEEIVKRTGLKRKLVQMVEGKHMASVHKRKMPLIPKLGVRTIGSDWRE